jgi:hypothetical protein
MIRPFTLLCMVLAGGSGLCLYQSKHRTQMLENQIADTLKQTQQTRVAIGRLVNAWTELNTPDRLSELAKAHLSLRPLQPTQFTALADLGAKLPAPVAPGQRDAAPPEPEPEASPAAPAVAQAAPPPAARPAPPRPVAVATPTPAPEPRPARNAEPRPAPATVAAAAPEPKPTRNAERVAVASAETRPARSAEPAKAAEREPAQAQSHQHQAPVQLAAAPAPRPAAPVTQVAANGAATAPGTVGEAVLRAMRANNPSFAAPAAQPIAQSAYVQPVSAAGPVGGSLLGGARTSLPPPVPFSSR